VGIALEEHDLAAVHGEQYQAYRCSVPMLIPGLFKRHRPPRVISP
jgi:protein-S-isoprenylcysteine O-methyltransferase Ste14